MKEEEKKALEAENRDMKALSEEELEGIAGGSDMHSNNKIRFNLRGDFDTGIGGGSKSSPKNFREEIG